MARRSDNQHVTDQHDPHPTETDSATSGRRPEAAAAHGEHAEHGEHPARAGHTGHAGHAGHDKHAGHDPEMFRRKFWLSLALTAADRGRPATW